MKKEFILIIFGIFVLVMVGSPHTRAGEIHLRPTRIWTLEDLKAHASERGPNGRLAASQLSYLGRPYYFDLLKEMADSRHFITRRTAIKAMASIGDSASIYFLREVLKDVSRESSDTKAAAYALAECRDFESIVTMENWIDSTDDIFLKNGLRDAIRRLKDPHHEEALIVQDEKYIRFKFLLDDIKTIRYGKYTSDRDDWFMLDSVAQDEYRNIFDMFGYSGPFRTPIPAHSGQPFRLIPDTDSGPFRTAIPADSGHARQDI